MTTVDPMARRRKYGMVRWIRDWNERHTQRIEYAPGFDPKTEQIGTPARETLKKVQRAAKLPVTGQFDAATMRLFFAPGIRAEVMASAHSQLGLHEWPPSSNRGEIVKFLESCGIGAGNPWCAAFVTWNLKRCGFKHYPPNPAYVPSWHSWAKEKNLLKPLGQSLSGDLWIWWKDGHIGFCDDTDPDDLVAYGLDGNVGAYGGSVTHVTRTSGEVTAVIDLVLLSKVK